MLLQRVSLKGFLAHRGVARDGAWAPIELDFRDANLWLMHGPNGSGKTSVIDAVTFALFGHVRGQQKPLGRFVNDMADRADIEVELEIGGVTYLVNREVTRLGRGSGRVSRRTPDGDVLLPGADDVSKWAERTLRLSYDNFVAAVILRQGEADVFLNAKPARRKEQLMKLLDLEVYRRLGEAANSRATAGGGRLKACQNALDAHAPVTDEDLTAASADVADAATTLATTRAAHGIAQTVLRDAGSAAALLKQIESLELDQQSDVSLLGQATAIETAAARHETLRGMLPTLDGLATRRAELAQERVVYDQAREHAASAAAQLEAVAPRVVASREDAAAATAALATAQAELAAAQQAKLGLEADLADLARVEGIEREVASARAQMAPFAPLLADSAAIAAAFTRYRELGEAGTALHPYVNARKALRQAADTHAAASTHSGEADAAVAAAEPPLNELREIALTLSGELEATRTRQEAVGRQQHTLRDKLEHRATVEHAEECPTCGSELRDPATRRRLADERVQWCAKLVELEAAAAALASERQALQARQVDAAAQLVTADRRLNAARSAAAAARGQIESAQRHHAERQREVETARLGAGGWADRVDDYQAICDEYKQLKHAGAETRHAELVAARQQVGVLEGKVEALAGQLAGLPSWSASERAALRAAATAAVHRWDAAEAAVQHAERDLKSAHGALQALEQRHAALVRQHDLAAQRESSSQEHLDAMTAVLDAGQLALEPPWHEHPAARDDAALRKLRDEFAALRAAPDRLRSWRAAQERVASLQAAIDALREQWRAVPEAHRVPVETASAHLAAALAAAADAETALYAATQRDTLLRRQREDYDRCAAARDAAEIEVTRAKKLASAFGTTGLQAKIVRDAQGDITGLANGILGRLSQGQWQVDLRENGAGTELEIVARDLVRGGVERTFECLSGGERFRVAISLAIAIGQSACGGHAMNTLVIDEGFGALDDINRALLVTELRHLAASVLQGGRIIVVSHQDDVRDEFDSRFHITRGTDGYASVERVLNSEF